MTPSRTLMAIALALSAMAAEPPAAAPAATNAPARPRQFTPPVRSPEVLKDGKVTFRIRAPKSAEVTINGQWPDGKGSLTKDTNGIWSITMGPIETGVWEYGFQVDGVGMIDPGNPNIKPMREPRTSILHLPSDPPRLYDFQDVPHGTVRLHTYRSKSLNRLRDLAVYTPPTYDQQSTATFPTLYLQHGSGDNQATWVAHGKAQWILDNLIAQGRAKPMVVVMMDGHAAIPGEGAGGPQNNTGMFERDLLEDVMPFVEATYRVKPDPQSRAIAGLSMGGEQSLRIGLNHLDRFSWVAGFSAAAPSREAVAGVLNAPDEANQKLKLLWIGVGKDDFLLKRNEEFVGLLKEKNIRHEWHLTEGNHSWPVWRGYLGELLPLLFQ